MSARAWAVAGICLAMLIVVGGLVTVGIYCLGPWIRVQYFQHNDRTPITDETYTYVYRYKQELLRRLTALLDSIGVRFVVAHGNLIEFVRGSPIYHDDDLDLRFAAQDMEKWMNWCKTQQGTEFPAHNLAFDGRLHDREKQESNGIQVRLINPPYASEACATMDVHADLVTSRTKTSDFWMAYDLDYSGIRRTRFMGADTWVPSLADAHRLLAAQYGAFYTVPHRDYATDQYRLLPCEL